MTSGGPLETLVLRSFTDAGIEAAREALSDLAAGYTVDVEGLLTNDDLTTIHSRERVVERTEFANRLEAAAHLASLLQPYENTIPDIERNIGLWTWLGFAWMELLAPSQGDGSKKLGEWRRWILSNDRKRNRHLLATPYRLLTAHRNDPSYVLVVLCGPVDTPGNMTEQISARPDIVKSRNIMDVVTRMYYEPHLGSASADYQAGVVGTLRNGAATSVARLGKVLGQFNLTWDMFAMDPEKISALLPNEFEKFTKNLATWPQS